MVLDSSYLYQIDKAIEEWLGSQTPYCGSSISVLFCH